MNIYDYIKINDYVNHKKFGKGIIDDIREKNDSVYLDVKFEIEGKTIVKSLSLRTAFTKGFLYFDDKKLNHNILCAITEETKLEDLKQEYFNNNIENKITENPIISGLIEDVLNDKSIAIELIKQYDNEEFQDELLSNTFLFLEKTITKGASLSKEHSAYIVVGLSYLALKYYDGDLHSYVEEEFYKYRETTPEEYSNTKIKKGMYEVLGDYRKKVQYYDSHSYVAVPIILSGVPHYRLSDLFVLSYDIYKKKLLFDEDIDDTQIYNKVLEAFKMLNRKNLISNSDVIKGTNYLMSKYTQSCIFSGKYLDSIVAIVTRCIRLIISYFTKPRDSFLIEQYYVEAFNDWIDRFESDTKERERYEKNHALTRPYFRLQNNNMVALITGKYSIDDIYDIDSVKIEICSFKSVIDTVYLDDANDIEYTDDNDALGGYIINQKKIVLKHSPLEELSYRIVCDDEILFDSKKKLYRKNIFFDGKGHEIKPGNEYNGELFVVTKDRNEDSEHNMEEYYCGEYNVSLIDVNSSEIFRFDNNPYVFYKVGEPQMAGYAVPWANFISVESKEYKIFKNVSFIFQAPCEFDEIELEVDHKILGYEEYLEYDWDIDVFAEESDGITTYEASIYELEPGFHNVRILNNVTRKAIKKAEFSFIYDDSIEKQFVERNDNGIRYSLYSDFISKENEIIDYEYGMQDIERQAFVKELGYGKIVVHPSTISYSTDGMQWHDIDKRFYMSDISEDQQYIYICGPEGLKVNCTDSEFCRKNWLNLEKTEDKYIYKLYISYLRTIFDKKRVSLNFIYGNRKKYLVTCYQPYVSPAEFYFDEENLCYNLKIDFEGADVIKCVVKRTNSDRIIISKEIHSGDIIKLYDSEIDESINFITSELYMQKTGGLFAKYESKPFLVLQKCSLERTKVEFTEWPPYIKYDQRTKSITCKFNFVNVDHLLIKLYPSGIDKALREYKVESGNILNIDIKEFPYNAYNILTFEPVRREALYRNKSVFTSKSIKTNSPVLCKKKRILNFRLKTGELVPTNSEIYFVSIKDVEDRTAYIGKWIMHGNNKTIDNIIMEKINGNEKQWELSFKVESNGKLNSLALKKSGVIESIIIRL